MKSKVALLAGALALVPAFAVADYCRDCGSDGYRGNHGQHVHRHVTTREVRHFVEHKRAKKHKQKHRYAASTVKFGRVIDVDPVYRHYTQVVDHGTCIQRSRTQTSRVSWTPAILGAVIGGAVGHRVGDSHGDPGVAAVAGGLLGASIGNDIGRHNRDSRELLVTGPCVSRDHRQTRREPVEYVVTYRYNGEVYRTHMDHHPGDWVELDVNIKPA